MVATLLLAFRTSGSGETFKRKESGEHVCQYASKAERASNVFSYDSSYLGI